MQAFPDRGKIRKALGKLKFLVTMDPLDTETSRFWEDFGPQNPSNPSSIQTEVFQLPTTCFAEENGTLVNSARWLQWHWKAADPPGDAQSDIWIMSGIFHRMREMYRKEGGAFPDPILNVSWDYTDPRDPDPEELSKDMNGRALVDLKDATGAVTLHAGQLLDGFAQLRDDGTTASGCWIFAGSFTEKGNQMAGATRPTRASRASRRTGPGPGRPIGGSSTTAPAPTLPARPGTRKSRSSNGAAPIGSVWTCPITVRPPNHRTGSVRSS